MGRVKANEFAGWIDNSVVETLSLSDRLAIGLDRLKRDRAVTNKELAEPLGFTESYMSQVMRGMRDVKLSTLDKIAKEWDVDIGELLTVTDADLPRVAALLARRKKAKQSDLPN